MPIPFHAKAGMSIQLPSLDTAFRDKCLGFVKEAKAIQDYTGAELVSTLVDKCDELEAVLRNMNRSLSAYRRYMPKFISTLNKLTKEEKK